MLRAVVIAAAACVFAAAPLACDDLSPRPSPEPKAPVGSQIVKPAQDDPIGPSHLDLAVERTSIPTCRRPMGLTLDRRGRLLVSCSLLGELQWIDPASMTVLETWEPTWEHLFRAEIVGDERVVAVGANGAFVHILDLRTGRHIERVRVGRSVGDMKRVPGTSRFLVSAVQERTVALVDAMSASVVREYRFPRPVGYVAVAKGGHVAAATGGVYRKDKSGTRLQTGQVYLFDPRTDDRPDAARTLSVGRRAREPVFVKNDSWILVPNFDDGTVSVFDVATRQLYRRLDVRPGPERIVVGPEGETAYCLNTRGSSVSVIRLSPLAVLRDIQLPASPEDGLVSPDGKLLVVTIPARGGSEGNRLALIDLAELRLVDLIPAGDDPAAVVQSADGRRVFVANFLGDSISIFE